MQLDGKKVGPSTKVIIHKVSKTLMKKTGSGPVDPGRVQGAQRVLESNTIDFAPMAMEYLSNIKRVLDKIQEGRADVKGMHQDITTPVMNLRANAKTFGYDLIGDLSNVTLNLLEETDSIDDDLVKILDAQYRILNVIIAREMKGAGGSLGDDMRKEFHAVYDRYVNKKQKLAG